MNRNRPRLARRVGLAAAAATDEAAGRMVASARPAGTGDDLRLAVDPRSVVSGAYPLALVTYEIACRAGSSPLTRSFLAYTASEAGQQELVRLGYAPLPAGVRERVAAAVAALS